MATHAAGPDDAFRRHGALAVGAVVALAFLGGGSSHGDGAWRVPAQLAALVVVGWAALSLHGRPSRRARLPRAPLWLAFAMLATVALLQAPLPAALWELSAARADLAGDLRAVGVDATTRWALSPLASERALWFLLPPVAAFAGPLALPSAHLRTLLLAVVVLAGASMLLGWWQMAVPRASLPNPYPRWAPAVSGFFENPNHQATLLAIAATIVAALPWRRPDGTLRRWTLAWWTLAAAAFATVPFTGSRAGIALAVLGVGAACLVRWLAGRRAVRAPGPRRAARTRTALVAVALAAPLLALVVAWQGGVQESVRARLAATTASLGAAHAPLGAGFGVFTPAFDASADPALVQWEYFHHAHDEYVQWWFELGVAGIALAVAALAIFATFAPRPARLRDAAARGEGCGLGVPLAAWLGCGLLWLHSVVDYPLRTPALATVAGLLAGVLVACHASARRAHPVREEP